MPTPIDWTIVRAMRAFLLANPTSQNQEISRRFDIDMSGTSRILAGISWKEHGYCPPKRKGKLTWPQVAAIREAYGSGTKVVAIAAHHGISPAMVCHIAKANRWKKDRTGRLMPSLSRRTVAELAAAAAR